MVMRGEDVLRADFRAFCWLVLMIKIPGGGEAAGSEVNGVYKDFLPLLFVCFYTRVQVFIYWKGRFVSHEGWMFITEQIKSAKQV